MSAVDASPFRPVVTPAARRLAVHLLKIQEGTWGMGDVEAIAQSVINDCGLIDAASPLNLNALRDACHNNAKDKGFHDPEVRPSVGESIALMHSELSEALEDHRKGHPPNAMWYLEKTPAGGRRTTDRVAAEGALNKPCGIPSEMADVIIRVFDFCGLHGIDIDRAVREKMAYNATRSFRHGDKKL